jgi:capsular polysaccharide biosynthesis protein
MSLVTLPAIRATVGTGHGVAMMRPRFCVNSTLPENATILELENRQIALSKLRYEEIDEILQMRPSLGRILHSLPPLQFTSGCHIDMNLGHLNKRFPRTLKVPKVALREYTDALCAPHQVLISKNMLLPDTYRHYTQPHLRNHYTKELNDYFAYYRGRLEPATELEGEYFFLVSEHPQHFGHLMTEQLSRLWAWEDVKALYPNAKALVSLKKGQQHLTTVERLVFTACGIAEDELVAIQGTARVQRVLAACPMFVNPTYAHPKLVAVWSQLSEALLTEAPLGHYSKRLFISRRHDRMRRCLNSDDVHDLFARFGFNIVYPEDYSLSEQVMMFNEAQVIAGFAGSGLFNLLTCREPKHVILVSATTYTARNEYLIGSILGHRLDVIWCDPVADRSAKRRRTRLQSDFVLNFDRDRRYVEELLRASG